MTWRENIERVRETLESRRVTIDLPNNEFEHRIAPSVKPALARLAALAAQIEELERERDSGEMRRHIDLSKLRDSLAEIERERDVYMQIAKKLGDRAEAAERDDYAATVEGLLQGQARLGKAFAEQKDRAEAAEQRVEELEKERDRAISGAEEAIAIGQTATVGWKVERDRAESAERERDEWKNSTPTKYIDLLARAEAAEQRVEELEETLEQIQRRTRSTEDLHKIARAALVPKDSA